MKTTFKQFIFLFFIFCDSYCRMWNPTTKRKFLTYLHIKSKKLNDVNVFGYFDEVEGDTINFRIERWPFYGFDWFIKRLSKTIMEMGRYQR